MEVISVCGPLSAEQLGPTDAHGHLFLRSPLLPGDEYEDLERSTEEARQMLRSGGRTVVDLTPIGLGRDANKLRRLAESSGINVIAATGFHRDAHYPVGHWAHKAPADVLMHVMRADLTEGIDTWDWQGPVTTQTQVRAGVIKLGASYHTISPAEDRRFAAGVQVAVETGAPIVVHTEIGTHGHEILNRLAMHGWRSGPVVLAHLDRNPDLILHREIASRGVYLIYDTVGRIKYRPESVLLDLVDGMCSCGFADRLLLGSDLARRSSFATYGGGPGLSYLFASFVPRLETVVGPDTVRQILIDNAGRAFASHTTNRATPPGAAPSKRQ